MPINIYEYESAENIITLLEDEWDLPKQINILKLWLIENHNLVSNVPTVEDIGFSIRAEAAGGGTVLDRKLISLLEKTNLEIYLSEYP